MRKLLLLALLLPATAQAQFDATKPATNTPPVSAEMRNNFIALQRTLAGAFSIVDPLFKSWPSGNTSAPQGAALTGAGATIAKTGTGLGDTTRKFGKFAAKVTAGGGATAILSKDLLAAADYDDGHDLLMWSFGAWVKCSSATSARLGINDGAGTTYSSYHTGGGSWEWLTVTRQIDAAATLVQVRIEVAASSNAHTAAWTPLFGETAPSYPQHDLAALVDRWGDQSIYGTKTFNVQPLVRAGTSTTLPGTVGGVYYKNVTAATVPVNTTDQVLADPGIAANMLDADGRAIVVRAASSTALTGANAKTIEIDVGGTQIQVFSISAAFTWEIEVRVVRIDSDSVDVCATAKTGTATSAYSVTRVNGLTFTAAVALRLLGTTAATSATLPFTFATAAFEG